MKPKVSKKRYWLSVSTLDQIFLDANCSKEWSEDRLAMRYTSVHDPGLDSASDGFRRIPIEWLDEGQLSRDTRESPLGKSELEKIHTSLSLSFFFSLSLCASFAPTFPLSGIGASRSLAIRKEPEEENRYGDLLRRKKRGGGRCTGRTTVPRTGTPR